MGILSRKITSFAKKVTDLPDRPGGTMSTALLKAQFDSSPEELRLALNGIVDDLLSTIIDASGAHNIGSGVITGVTGSNVYDQLVSIKQQLNNVALGVIPDRSIGREKFSQEVMTKQIYKVGW